MTLYEHYQIEREEGREEGRITGLAEGLATGREEGYARSLVSSVEALMTNAGWSLVQACENLNINVEEYNKAKQLII